MTPAELYDEEQRVRWNGADGDYWVAQQQRLDRTLAPVSDALLAFAEPVTGAVVIDVGCGCGATTIEFARAVGAAGRVVGVDLSEPMLAVAKVRLRRFSNTAFLNGDAATVPLQGTDAELMASRFGVMFFGDPVAAFANLRTGLARGGRLRFACWRSVGENPWLQVPLHAVYEHAPRLPGPDPEEPGPFAFADTERVTRILTAAGFTAPTFTPLDIEMDLAAGGTLEDAVRQSSEMGPAKRALEGQPEEIRVAAVESIRKALTPFANPEGVRLAGGVWLVSADN